MLVCPAALWLEGCTTISTRKLDKLEILTHFKALVPVHTELQERIELSSM